MSKPKSVAYIFGNNNITIYYNGEVYNICESHPNFNEIVNRLSTKNYDSFENILDIPKSICAASNNKVVVKGDSVYYGDKEIHNVIVDRILDFSNKGYPFESLVNFLENLLKNPNESAINELYLFLQSGNMPITEDGCFLAYKKVSNELKSFYPDENGVYINHSIGSKVSMPREDVDTNRNNTCSVGLHFCSLKYLPKYHGGSGRVVIVKINPMDVCSIPSDYENTKGRTCAYEVVAEYDYESRETVEAFEDSYVESSNVVNSMVHIKANKKEDSYLSYGVKPNGSLFHNVRDKNGRFIKKSQKTYSGPYRDSSGRFAKRP